ncbi:MAG: tetratricopeptide repeat protein [Rhodothalassiaceae bacterium]
MADESELIFREVDEEVRRDRLIALLKKHGPRAAVVLVLVIAGVIGYRYWEAQRERALRAEAARYVALVESIDKKSPAEMADILAEARPSFDGGYALLVRMREAGARAKAGQLAVAIGLYDEVARMADDPRLKAYAALFAAEASLDSEGPATAIARLEPLAAPEAPLRFSALELLGAAELAAGDTEAARSRFSGLVEDPETPPGIKARARDMLASMGAPPEPGAGDEDGADAAPAEPPVAAGEEGAPS